MASPRSKGSAPWSCPVCGREFARTRQAHSCRSRGVRDHFRGKDQRLAALFEKLKSELARRGPLRVDAVQSTINLASKYPFAGVSVRRDGLHIGFIADREIHDRRIIRAVRVGPARFSHFLRVRSPKELDARVLGWLAEAQALQAGAP